MPPVVSARSGRNRPRRWHGTIGPAVGRSGDFQALVYCPDLDEAEKEVDPSHREYTFVIRFVDGRPQPVGRWKRRLEDLWAAPGGPILAVGAPAGVIQVDAEGLTEIPIPGMNGVATCIWGADAANVFIAGGPIDPFIYCRQEGQWRELPLPSDSRTIWDLVGLGAQEVYFVGDEGQILLWDGRQVSRLRSPTTRTLVSVARLNDQQVCAAGYDGTLLVGNRQGWRAVPTDTSDDLLSLAGWGGRIYFGADAAVWAFDGRSRPAPVLQAPARVLSGLGDGLVLSRFTQAHLYTENVLSDLSVTVT